MRISPGQALLPALSLLAGCSGAPSSRGSESAMPPVALRSFDKELTVASTDRSLPSLPGITVVQAVGGVVATGALTLTPAVPHPGDLLLIFGAVSQHIPRTSAPPSGFVEITSGKDDAPDSTVCYPSQTCIANYYKIASAAEPTSYVFTDADPNTKISASFLELAGVDSANPIVSQAWHVGRNKTLSCPPAGAADLALCLVADNAGTNAPMLVPPVAITSGWSLVPGTEQVPAGQSSMAFVGPANTAMTATLQTKGSPGGWAATTVLLKAKVAPTPAATSPPSPTPSP